MRTHCSSRHPDPVTLRLFISGQRHFRTTCGLLLLLAKILRSCNRRLWPIHNCLFIISSALQGKPGSVEMGEPAHLRDCPLDCKVYVGNLGNSGNKTELERAFGYYGPLRSVWVARNPPGFAFVEFEDPRDATDAVRELDGRTLCGCRVRVELSNGEKRSRSRGPPPSWSRRTGREDYSSRRRGSPPVRRRVITIPLLTTLSDSQLVLLQHHVTTDQRQHRAPPNQLGWCRVT
ncbi:unnamed protein product [Oncorhynchus mykiss]|uniref:RRM domain-containing protein n=1 Tax=Oncorhynchus mykiss TaxID=8022 RepID=A0A060Y6L4_ONCMY|nr:unnamed protein product [Oncorhynchus mykiss]